MSEKRRSTNNKSAQQRLERRATFADATPKREKRSIGVSTTSETPLNVRALGMELEPGVREHVRERVSFKLGKFALAINRISVRFDNVAGPTGAPLVECRFKVVLRQATDVVLSGRGETAGVAFDKAVASAERTVRRTLEKVESARTRVRAR